MTLSADQARTTLAERLAETGRISQVEAEELLAALGDEEILYWQAKCSSPNEGSPLAALSLMVSARRWA